MSSSLNSQRLQNFYDAIDNVIRIDEFVVPNYTAPDAIPKREVIFEMPQICEFIAFDLSKLRYSLLM